MPAAIVPVEDAWPLSTCEPLVVSHTGIRRRFSLTQNTNGEIMKTLFVGVLGLFTFMAMGCGSSSSGGGAATTACTTGTGTSKVCFELSTNSAAVGGVAAAKSDCTQSGGVVSDTCSHVGADGGCKATVTSGTVSVTTTFWYYTGSASSEMSSCTSGGDTWISP